ncbi:hypothetical protein [Synechococcus sp. UW105]|uniref:hypothetical protein n=1 Tax=Synechococcus sp. UW105 TaxID=337067 RepID=UPI000E0E92A1|nr:hypothetical protein [Synechococcus sp. UW105]
MDAFTLGYGPLNDPAILRGSLFWALALYLPLSRPLGRFESSLIDGPLNSRWQQVALLASSLLLALAVGLGVQLLLSWTLGPGWGSSLALITVGWSLFLLVASSQQQDER